MFISSFSIVASLVGASGTFVFCSLPFWFLICVCESLLWQEWSKIGQKSTSILQSKCVFVNVWFFSVHVNRCWCECESVLVWWVRVYMYSLVWQQCTSEKLFFCCWFYYRYDFLCTEKSGKNSHLLSVKWFEDHNFNSKVVLVIRFLVCCHSCQLRVASDLRAVLPVVLGWNLSKNFCGIIRTTKNFKFNVKKRAVVSTLDDDCH